MDIKQIQHIINTCQKHLVESIVKKYFIDGTRSSVVFVNRYDEYTDCFYIKAIRHTGTSRGLSAAYEPFIAYKTENIPVDDFIKMINEGAVTECWPSEVERIITDVSCNIRGFITC